MKKLIITLLISCMLLTPVFASYVGADKIAHFGIGGLFTRYLIDVHGLSRPSALLLTMTLQVCWEQHLSNNDNEDTLWTLGGCLVSISW